jgi:hypothetical protein
MDLKIREHITRKIPLRIFHFGSSGDVAFQSEMFDEEGAG